jgi:hypothetical protein
MSDIVGIFQLDSGPDAKTIWIDERGVGPVVLGHAFLKTNWEAERRHKPLNFWQCMDRCGCAVGRAAQPEGQPRGPSRHEELVDAPEAEMTLRTYDVWDERCW